MREFLPVGHVIGRLSTALGLTMAIPAALDFVDGAPSAPGMALAAFLTIVGGASITVLCRTNGKAGLSRRQAIVLTVVVWLILPVFGALPFVFGAPGANYTDAFFEAMSGLTTTGSTVFSGLADAPRGMLLWRAMLQWFGGVGIVVVAMVFLPVLKIGGMQFFRTESFDLLGDILPRAAEAAQQISLLYLGLTAACMIAYSAAGMNAFDALCHAMTTVSTGGLANYDDSFGAFGAGAQYVAIVFMMLAALPFIALVQFTRGNPRPMWRDAQIRGFVGIIATVAAVLTLFLLLQTDRSLEPALRSALFNLVSAMTGTGYASEDYSTWGSFPQAIFFLVMLIGGCAGSTACSAKVFRYQILIAALNVQIRRIHSPRGVHTLRYGGRPVEQDVLSSVMAFFFIFAATIAVWAILLSQTGVDDITAISGSVAALANVGPGLGEVIGPAGNFATLPDSAKWILAAGMLMGRLEFMSVLVLFTRIFWMR